MSMFEPMFRDAMIRAIDGMGKKVADSERAAEGAINRLLTRWNAMDRMEKEQVAAVVVATATTAVGAIAALRARSPKKVMKKVAKKVVKRATEKA